MIILNKISQTEKDKYHAITYMWNLKKMVQVDLFTKQKQTDIENKLLWLPKGKEGQG